MQTGPAPSPRTTTRAAALTFALAFFYQWTRPAFTNDHFELLAKAQQVLYGDWPIRDFFDNGRPLTIAASALALHLSGGTLLGEALVTITAISLGVALVFALTTALTGSRLLAAWAAFCTMALEPRLYNYGKILLATLGLWLAFRYVDRPTPRRAALIGICGGLAFLIRHDLGMYLAVLATGTFLVTPEAAAVRRLKHALLAILVAALLVAPYLGYLASIGRLGGTTTGGGATFLDVAWRATLSFTFLGAAWAPWSIEGAQQWIYAAFLAAPLVALATVVVRRGRLDLPARKAATLAVFSGTLVVFLVRGNLDSRLPDVAAASFVLIAWLVGTGLRARPTRVPEWLPAAAAVALLCTITIAASELGGNPVRRFLHYLRLLPGSVTTEAALLDGNPVAWWEQDGVTDVRGVARWLRECAPPTSRVLVFGYYPDIVFFSRRPFAGGQPFLHSGYFSTDAEQDLTVERLSREEVPFVVVEQADRPALDGTYGRIGAYVKAHYRKVAESGFSGPRRFAVYQRTDVQPSTRPDGLPCFR